MKLNPNDSVHFTINRKNRDKLYILKKKIKTIGKIGNNELIVYLLEYENKQKLKGEKK